MDCIDLNCLNVSGTRSARTTTVSAMIEKPQRSPTVSWKNTMTLSKTSISGCRMLAMMGHQEWGVGVGRVRNRRWAATGSKPPWLNGLQRSSRHPASTRPAQYAELADRLDRVGRAGRLVLAAPRQRRRDHALVEPRSAPATSRRARALTSAPGRAFGRRAPRARAHALEALALGELAHLGPGDDDDVVVVGQPRRPRSRTPRAAGA